MKKVKESLRNIISCQDRIVTGREIFKYDGAYMIKIVLFFDLISILTLVDAQTKIKICFLV